MYDYVKMSFFNAFCDRRIISVAFLFLLLRGAAVASPTPGIDWPTFGGSAQRTGYNASETLLSTGTVPQLRLHWSAQVGAGSYLQPTLVRGVQTAAGTFDLVFTTESYGTLTALDTASGHVIWTTKIPLSTLNCEGQTYSVGLHAPATIDVGAGRLYVVDGGGLLHALAISTGIEVAGYPIEVIDSANRGAATLDSHASPTLVGTALYITTAVLPACEKDNNPYHGQVIKFDTVQGVVVKRYYPLGNSNLYGGGIWGPGGVSVEPDGSFLWIATANALSAPRDQNNAEKVVQLDPDLNQIAVNGPALKPGGDLDFGATPLLFQPTGCPPMLAAMNKSGILVVYNRGNLSQGAVQTLQISHGGGSGEFLGMPAFDPVTNAVYLNNPASSDDGRYLYGLIALRVDTSCKLSLLWRQKAGVTVLSGANPAIPPTVANGVVWYAGGIAGQVAAFNAVDGTPLWDSGTSVDKPTKAAPLVANGQVFFMGGTFIYAYGL